MVGDGCHFHNTFYSKKCITKSALEVAKKPDQNVVVVVVVVVVFFFGKKIAKIQLSYTFVQELNFTIFVRPHVIMTSQKPNPEDISA